MALTWLMRGENSFASNNDFVTYIEQFPHLQGVALTTDAGDNPILAASTEAALVEAWFNIGALQIDLGRGDLTTRYLNDSALDALSSQQRADLAMAQLFEADHILTTHQSERNATARRITVGETTTVYRNNQAIIVAPAAVRILRPYMVPGQFHSAVMHP